MATQNYFKVKNGLEFPSIETLQTTDNTGPSIKPSLNLDFAKTKSLDPRITFSRASAATYYDGKTTAKAEENLLTNSQTFDSSNWTKYGCTITADVTAAPDGTTTADQLIETTATGAHSISYSAGAPTSGVQTFSIFAKYVNRQWFRIDCSYGAGSHPTFFDLQNGVLGNVDSAITASIAPVGNGWYRCSVTTPSVSVGFYPGLAITNGTIQYTGDTSSSVYIWGAQLEQRGYATAYTATTSSPITNYIPVLQTSATNTARFDHDPVTGESKGLLIEESRTNLILHSQSMDVSYWSIVNGSLIANATVAPDGNSGADLYVANAASSLKGVLPFGGVTISANSVHTLSYYVKSYGPQYVALTFDDTATTNGLSATFDLVNGTVSRTATAYGTGTASGSSITPIGNGWYRISVSGTAGTGVSFARCILTIAPNSTAQFSSYTGNGFSGIYVWGAQLEAGAFPTSYIPTLTTFNSRASTATYRSSDGTIRTAAANVVRYEPNASGGSNIVLESSSTNLFTYNNDLANSVWTALRINVASNSDVAPDGSLTADRIIENTVSDEHMLRRIMTGLTTNGTYTVSTYVKSVNGRSFRIRVLDTGNVANGYYAEWVLTTGTNTFTTAIGSGSVVSSSITPVGRDWYRVSLTGSGGATCTTYTIDFYSISSGQSVYVGDNSSGIIMWGTQLESGSNMTSVIPSVETFTGRSSTSTYIDSTGSVRTAASGQVRHTYNMSLLSAAPKLLLEPQSTNLIASGNTLSGFNLEGSGGIVITRNSSDVTAPDGSTSSAIKIDSTGVTNTDYSDIVHYVGGGLPYAGTTKTFSVFVKGTPGQTMQLKLDRYGAGGSYYQHTFTGNWDRISVTYSIPSDNTLNLIARLGIRNLGAYTTGTAGVFYAWGAQVEDGYSTTSYIPTTGSTVTRSADTSTSSSQTRAADVYSSSQVTRGVDVAYISGTNFTSWFNQREWSAYGEANGSLGANCTAAVLEPNTAQLGLLGNSTILPYRDGRSTGGVAGSFLTTVTNFNKFAAAWDTASRTAYGSANGGAVASNSTLPFVENNILYLGRATAAGAWVLNGTIKKLAFYPKRLTNAELVSITS